MVSVSQRWRPVAVAVESRPDAALPRRERRQVALSSYVALSPDKIVTRLQELVAIQRVLRAVVAVRNCRSVVAAPARDRAMCAHVDRRCARDMGNASPWTAFANRRAGSHRVQSVGTRTEPRRPP